MYDSILIPIDGSEQSMRGLDAGLEIAAEHDATVIVLYVVDERRFGHTPAFGSLEADLDRVEADGCAVLEEAARRAEAAGLSAECRCQRGTPWEEIADVAATEADLVVMGRRRRRPIGSVTEQVQRHAPVATEAV